VLFRSSHRDSPTGQVPGTFRSTSHLKTPQHPILPSNIRQHALYVAEHQIVRTKKISNFRAEKILSLLLQNRRDTAANGVEGVPTHDIAHTCNFNCRRQEILPKKFFTIALSSTFALLPLPDCISSCSTNTYD
jgi:hypothetical protein